MLKKNIDHFLMYTRFADVVIINTLNATVSNSSGNYFIAQQTNDLNNGEINCNSNKTCSVQSKFSTS